MSINRVEVMGNLGADVDLRFLPDGRAVGNFSVACGEQWKDKTTGEKKEHTEWIRCVCFGKRAEIIAEYHKKGSQIYVSGKMRTRKWQDQAGVDRYTTEVVVDDFQFCGQRAGGGSDAKAQEQARAYQQQGGNRSSNEPPMPDAAPGGYDFDDDIPF